MALFKILLRIRPVVLLMLFLPPGDTCLRVSAIPACPSHRQVADSTGPKSLRKKIGVFKTSDSTRRVTTNAVVITGSRQEIEATKAPVAVDVIRGDRIQRAGAASLQSILQEQSIVATRSSLQTGVQLMGMNADYTQILVDGLPLVGRVAGVIDINRIAIGNIDQIEIVKGPMSSLYGSEALAGVINLRTRRAGTGWNGGVQSQWQSIQGYQAAMNVGYGGEVCDFMLFLDTRSSPPFEQRSDSLVVPYAGFTDATIQSKLRWRLPKDWDIEGTVRMFRSRSEGKFVESFYTQVAANKGSVVQGDLNAAVSANFRRGDLHVLMQLYGTRFSEEYTFDVAQGSAGTEDYYERSLIRPFVQANLLVGDRIRCTMGAEVAIDNIRGTRYPGSPGYTTSVLYGQWEGNPIDNLSYSLSARYDANSEFGDNINPKLAVMYEPLPELRVRASLGTGFKAPDFRQLYVVFRNNLQGAGYLLTGARLIGQDLQAERSVSADVSITFDSRVLTGNDGNTRLNIHADVRAYENAISQMIEFYLHRIDGQTSVYSYRNVARVRTRGVELNGRCEYVVNHSDTLIASIGYQYLRAEDADVMDAIADKRAGSIDRSSGRFIPLTYDSYGGLWFRSPHMMNMRLEYVFGMGITLSLRADYTGSFADEALDKNGSVLANTVRVVPDRADEYVDGYWNARCNLWINMPSPINVLRWKTMRIGIGGSNLFDARNLRSTPSVIGRQFSLQAQVQF